VANADIVSLTSGAASFYNGSSGSADLMVDVFGYFAAPPTPVVSAYTLSMPTYSGQAVGTGSATSPAVSYTQTPTPMTVSSTLTSSSGAVVPGVNTTMYINPEPAGLLVTSNGVTESPTPVASGGDSYTIPTNSAGEAAAQLSVPADTSASFTLYFTAPFNEANGKPVTSADSYGEFVAPNSIGISPFGTSSDPYVATVSSTSNETTGIVTVTATLPPINGSPQTNVEVTFSTTSPAFFSNSQGGVEGTDGGHFFTAFTNSSGQATALLNSDSSATAPVTAYTTTASATTYLFWGEPGIPEYVVNRGVSNITGGTPSTGVTATTGNDVTLSGTVVDSTKAPVANAELLITSEDGHGSYVTGSGSTATTTPFPNAEPVPGANVSSTGAPYGTVVTTGTDGSFSVTVTDSTSESDVYQVWYVQNGSVSSEAPFPLLSKSMFGLSRTSGAGNYEVTYSVSTAVVSNVGVAVGNGLAAAAAAAAPKPAPSTLTGVSYTVTDEYPSGANKGQISNPSAIGQIEIGAFTGNNADYLAANPTSSVTYQVSANNSGFISEVDGVLLDGSVTSPAGLPNKPSAVSITVNGSGSSTGYEVLVNGVSIMGASSYLQPTGTSATTDPSFVNVGISDQKAETDTFTTAVGTLSATATVQFTPGPVAHLTANPSTASPTSGTTQTVTYTAVDANNNPVPNAPVTIVPDGLTTGLWITAVNGTSLTEDIGTNGASEPTPIPLYNTTSGLGYGSVVIPNTVSWTSSKSNNPSSTTSEPAGYAPVTFTTNARGTFSVTYLNANVDFWGNHTTGLSAQVSASQSTFSSTAYVEEANTTPQVFSLSEIAPVAPATTVGTVIYGTTLPLPAGFMTADTTAPAENGSANVSGATATFTLNGSSETASYASNVEDFMTFSDGQASLVQPMLVPATGGTGPAVGDELAVWQYNGSYYYLDLTSENTSGKGGAPNTDYVGFNVTVPTGTVSITFNGQNDHNATSTDVVYVPVATYSSSSSTWTLESPQTLSLEVIQATSSGNTYYSLVLNIP
jgi:protocatechuate 3,4-dioxygenase beta subunit